MQMHMCPIVPIYIYSDISTHIVMTYHDNIFIRVHTEVIAMKVQGPNISCQTF